MIKVEHIDVYGWETAIRGMRNAMNSWDKSDSYPAVDCGKCGKIEKDGFCKKENRDCTGFECYVIGKNDLTLMKKLCKAGTDHRKFMRMITVDMDITAPLYWWKEYDTYKVGTVANSCSTMHRLLEKPFELKDFSYDKLIQHTNKYFDVEPEISKQNEIWVDIKGFENYKISNRGVVIRKERETIYPDGKAHHFKEKVVAQCVNSSNYKKVSLHQNGVSKNLYVHRLMAEMFIPNPNNYPVVNHKDGNKWNNNINNLEWCTHQENDLHAVKMGLKKISGYNRYRVSKTQRRFSYEELEDIKEMYNDGFSIQNIADKYECYSSIISNILSGKTYKEIELTSLDLLKINIDAMNELRDYWFNVNDNKARKEIWYQIVQLLPTSYNQKRTVQLNYEVLANMYHSRKAHKLDEWVDFCKEIEKLPYSELITGVER